MKGYKGKLEQFFSKENFKENWHLFTAVGIVLMAFWLRYIPASEMTNLQALDTYLNLRISQHVAMEGTFPLYDFMRYFPFNQPTYLSHLGTATIPAVLYWMGPFLVFSSYVSYAQAFPAIMGAATVFFAYLLGKEMWGDIAGVTSAFFLATIAGIMHRSSAGFFDKEPIGGLFMMISLYCFVRAWNRDSWIPGIFSGLALGLFTISWGGASVLWLLYPLTVGTVLFFDEDIAEMMKAYTPTIIIAGVLAASLNPSRFWLTSPEFLANLGLLGLLWSRYTVDEFNIVKESQLPYYMPSLYALGALAAVLSPLYSNFIASSFMGLLNRVTGDAGAVIAGTVAENTSMGMNQLVSQLGAVGAIQVNTALGLLANIAGSWPLSFIGFAFLSTYIVLMIAKKYRLLPDGNDWECIKGSNYYYLFVTVFAAWVMGFSAFFSYVASEFSFMVAVMPSVLAVLGSLGIIYTFEAIEDKNIEFRWYYILPLFWYLASVLRTITQSRVIFLAAFPVAMMAGYMSARVITRLYSLDYSLISQKFNADKTRLGIMALVVGIIFAVNLASGYAAVSQISESPEEPWNQTLEYMADETDNDSVILSWWDYGYWFQTIGERATVADGGNSGYFTTEGPTNKVPHPIARFLTSNNASEHASLFEKHSADYIVLDNTMIGKYSAVSQIANEDNENFQSLYQVQTEGTVADSISQDEDSQIVQMRGRGMNVYMPVQVGNRSVEIVGQPTVQTRSGRIDVNCVLTENGRMDFGDGSSSELCLAKDPFYSIERGLGLETTARAALIPESEADSALVRLYFMDGQNMEWVEKVEEASNGYVKMWEVTDTP